MHIYANHSAKKNTKSHSYRIYLKSKLKRQFSRQLTYLEQLKDSCSCNIKKETKKVHFKSMTQVRWW